MHIFTEENFLKLLQVQSNLGPDDFDNVFGKKRGRSLFQLFARDSWNLISFMFNKVNGEDRKNLLEYINNKLKQ
jgi:hypothetical protein